MKSIKQCIQMFINNFNLRYLMIENSLCNGGQTK